tara:strand:- start:20221 stop:24336 length:4116 start_codon:yes stop_codon:yes gene_type:complete
MDKFLEANIITGKKLIVKGTANITNIDVSNFEYTNNNYVSDNMNVTDSIKCQDISVNTIKIFDNNPTGGVIQFLKPIECLEGSFNKIIAYDVCFEKLKVNSIMNVKNIHSYNNESKITIINDVCFNEDIFCNDICVNTFNLNNINNEINVLSDISSTEKELKTTDISVNIIQALTNNNDIRFDKDISINAINIMDVSTDKIIVGDISVNIIESYDSSINIINDVNVDGKIEVDLLHVKKISCEKIISDISIDGTLKADNIVFKNKLQHKDSNKTIIFVSKVEADLSLSKYDISINNITNNSTIYNVPNKRIQQNINNNYITTHAPYSSYLNNNSPIVIDGDISINGNLSAEWNKCGMNQLYTVYGYDGLLNISSDLDIGTIVIQRTDNIEELYIKSGNNSWHKIFVSDSGPYFVQFLLNSDSTDSIGNIFTNPIYNSDNSYTNIEGIDDITELVFYIEKYNNGTTPEYILDICYNEDDNDPINYKIEPSFNNYLNGLDWGISLATASSGYDISQIKIIPPINNDFDFSINVTIEQNKEANKLPSIRKIIFRKKNDLPIWKHMIITTSNDNLPIPEQSWTNFSDQDSSYTFNVRYYNPESNIGNFDTSYYIIDLSSIDPEQYDVSYRINTIYDSNFYEYSDWSWNIIGDKIYIKIPGEQFEDKDFSFEIVSHDNIDNNKSSNTYYENIFDSCKQIVKFHKLTDETSWEYIKFITTSNLLDSSWNKKSWYKVDQEMDFSYIDDIVDASFSFLYSSYSDAIKLDISSLSLHRFEASYNIDIKTSTIPIPFNFHDNQLDISISDIPKVNNIPIDISLEIANIIDTSEKKILHFIRNPNISIGNILFNIEDTIQFKFSHNGSEKLCIALPKNKNITTTNINNINSLSYNGVAINSNSVDVFIVSAAGDGGAAAVGNELEKNGFTRAVFSGASGGGGAKSIISHINYDTLNPLDIEISYGENKEIIYNSTQYSQSPSGGNANNFKVSDTTNTIVPGGAALSSTTGEETLYVDSTDDFTGWNTIYEYYNPHDNTSGGNASDVNRKSHNFNGSANVPSGYSDGYYNDVLSVHYKNLLAAGDITISDSSLIYLTPNYPTAYATHVSHVEEVVIDGVVQMINVYDDDGTWITAYAAVGVYYDDWEWRYPIGYTYYVPEPNNTLEFIEARAQTHGRGGWTGGDGSNSDVEWVIKWPDGDFGDVDGKGGINTYDAALKGWGAIGSSTYIIDNNGNTTTVSSPRTRDLYHNAADGIEGPGGNLYYNDDDGIYFSSTGDLRLRHMNKVGGQGEPMDKLYINTDYPLLGKALDNNNDAFNYNNFLQQTSGSNGQSINNNIVSYFGSINTPTVNQIRNARYNLNSTKGEVEERNIPDYPIFLIFDLN